MNKTSIDLVKMKSVSSSGLALSAAITSMGVLFRKEEIGNGERDDNKATTKEAQKEGNELAVEAILYHCT